MTRRGRPPKIGRDEIAAATLTLLRERGLTRLTTRAIASHLGISEGSIFYHFGDRQGLIKATFEHTLGSLWDFHDLPDRAPTNLDDVRHDLLAVSKNLSVFLQSALDVLLVSQADLDMRAEVFAMMDENDYGPNQGVGALADYLRSAQAAGVVDPKADAHTMAYLLVSSILLRAIQPRLVGHERGIVDAEHVVDTVIAALRP